MVLLKKDTDELTYKANKLADRNNKLYGYQRGKGGYIRSLGSIYIYIIIYKIDDQ